MLQVFGDSGKAVDWWFIYKISGNAKPQADGSEYVYFDSDKATDSKAQLVLSKDSSGNPRKIDDPNGPLFLTLNQVLGDAAKTNRQLGWFCYNDEDRMVKKVSKGKTTFANASSVPERGHCKGVLAFDLASDSAFWLVHSVPMFPVKAQLQYPDSGHVEAQTMLCISLKDAGTAMNIAQLMFDAHGPNVNVASDLLGSVAGLIKPSAPIDPKLPANNCPQGNWVPPNSPPKTDVPKSLAAGDPRLSLMKNLNGSLKKAQNPSGKDPSPYPPLDFNEDNHDLDDPFPGRVPFLSRRKQKFLAIAKNRLWDLDFYNDLVSKVLDEDLDVETWEDGQAGNPKKIPPLKERGDHPVRAATGVDLNTIGIEYTWPESNDHSKLCISDKDADSDKRFICVGDINFTDAQETRGGGTVAFQCDPLWSCLDQVLIFSAAASKNTPSKKTSNPRPSSSPKTTGQKPSPVRKKSSTKTKSSSALVKTSQPSSRSKSVNKSASKKPADKKTTKSPLKRSTKKNAKPATKKPTKKTATKSSTKLKTKPTKLKKKSAK